MEIPTMIIHFWFLQFRIVTFNGNKTTTKREPKMRFLMYASMFFAYTFSSCLLRNFLTVKWFWVCWIFTYYILFSVVVVVVATAVSSFFASLACDEIGDKFLCLFTFFFVASPFIFLTWYLYVRVFMTESTRALRNVYLPRFNTQRGVCRSLCIGNEIERKKLGHERSFTYKFMCQCCFKFYKYNTAPVCSSNFKVWNETGALKCIYSLWTRCYT